MGIVGRDTSVTYKRNKLAPHFCCLCCYKPFGTLTQNDAMKDEVPQNDARKIKSRFTSTGSG